MNKQLSLNEAFTALDDFELNEDVFPATPQGVEELKVFMDGDVDDTIEIVDSEASSADQLKDDYIGKVILECDICHSLNYKDRKDVIIDEETDVANVDEECPVCAMVGGFTVVGEVKPFDKHDHENLPGTEAALKRVDESIKEFVELPRPNKSIKEFCNNIRCSFSNLEYKESDEEFSNNNTYTKQGHSNDINGYENKVRNIPGFDLINENIIDNSTYYRDYSNGDVVVHFDISKDNSKMVIYSNILEFLNEASLQSEDTKLDLIAKLYEEAYNKSIPKIIDGMNKILKENGADLSKPWDEGVVGLDVDKAYDELAQYLKKVYTDLYNRLEYEVPRYAYELLGFNKVYYEKELADLKKRYGIVESLSEDLKEDWDDEEHEELPAYDKRGIHAAPLKIKGSDFEDYLGYWMADYDYEARDKAIDYTLDSSPIEVHYLAQDEMSEESLNHLAQLANKWLSINGYLGREVFVSAKARDDAPEIFISFKVSSSKNIAPLYDYLVGDTEGEYEKIFQSLETATAEATRLSKDGTDIRIYELPRYSYDYIDYFEPYLKRSLSEKTTKNEIEEDFSAANGLAKYQEWVDFDMKKYGRISGITKNKLDKAGLEVVKDDHGDYEVIAKEDNGELKESRKRYKKITEDVGSVEVKADGQKVEVKQDDDKTTVEVSKECKDCEEVIEPVSDEVKKEIESNGEDVEISEFDEESFDELGESYLKEVYGNIKSYKTTGASLKDNKLKLEGLIEFNSGKRGKTTFLFESRESLKSGKIRMMGLNEKLSRNARAFTLVGNAVNNKFISESFSYNYATKDSDGKVQRVHNRIKRSK